jgi:uncharacterized damage-inducible protein DinB
MSTVETFIQGYEFNRGRTLDLLARIEQLDEPRRVLAWRPGPGRAHIGWQLMHIGVTEEIFATERLCPDKARSWEELWPRFRGGGTPDDDAPTPEQIREVLAGAREHLLASLRQWGDARLNEVPESLAARGWTFQTVLAVIGWHESHHQGQAHLTLNLHQAARA